jgi:hypothetical protein
VISKQLLVISERPEQVGSLMTDVLIAGLLVFHPVDANGVAKGAAGESRLQPARRPAAPVAGG